MLASPKYNAPIAGSTICAMYFKMSYTLLLISISLSFCFPFKIINAMICDFDFFFLQFRRFFEIECPLDKVVVFLHLLLKAFDAIACEFVRGQYSPDCSCECSEQRDQCNPYVLTHHLLPRFLQQERPQGQVRCISRTW